MFPYKKNYISSRFLRILNDIMYGRHANIIKTSYVKTINLYEKPFCLKK